MIDVASQRLEVRWPHAKTPRATDTCKIRRRDREDVGEAQWDNGGMRRQGLESNQGPIMLAELGGSRGCTILQTIKYLDKD